MRVKNSSDYFTNPVLSTVVKDLREEMEFEAINMSNERRFRVVVGCAPLTDYISVRASGGYIVRKKDPELIGADGSQTLVSCITLEYCLCQVDCGNWEELEIT